MRLVDAGKRLVCAYCLWINMRVGGASSYVASPSSAQHTLVNQLAEQYVRLLVSYDPTTAVWAGLPLPSTMRLPDRTQAGLRAFEQAKEQLLRELKRDAKDVDDPTYQVLEQELQSTLALGVCHRELWNISQTEGWQVQLPALAHSLPVATPEDRSKVVQLWTSLPAYIQTEISNLTTGLQDGYTVPQSVAQRVLVQMDRLVAESGEASPFFYPASQSDDNQFRHELLNVQTTITASLQKYRNFLRDTYIPRARATLGLSALPHGDACYQAYLRRYTTTEESPEFIFSTGEKLALKSTSEIQDIGWGLYRTRDVRAIVERTRADNSNRFSSAEQLLDYSKSIVSRSKNLCVTLFSTLPAQDVIVRPLPEFQRGTGVSSHYEANPNSSAPATFWLAIDHWQSDTRGAAEITAVHETIPGHHLQIASARQFGGQGLLSAVVYNSAYTEGWAHYAEQLAEEQGIDSDDYERIQRRIVAGRSLVIDPGIHKFDWSRQRAEKFLMATGMNLSQADDVIDRVVIEPGQLTSYEVGGLEILRLREEARSRLGSRFSLKAFHQEVLKEGSIPLATLRNRVQRWIRAAPK